jgi:hypothetical protein
VAQHLLHGAEVGASLEQVRREGVAQEVRVDAPRLQAGLPGELAEDEERAGPGQRPAARVEEELRPVTAIEVGATQREVAADGLGRRSSERDDPLLPALAEHADDPLVEVDAALLEPDGLGHAQAGAVQELDERAIPARARSRPVGGVDQPLRLGGRHHAREALGAPG